MNIINQTIASTITSINKSLCKYYSEKEIESFVFYIFNYLLNYSKIDIHLNRNKFLSEEHENSILQIVSDLKKSKPIQYILGETEFYGLRFFVNEHVLIPRPETEELVDWIIKESAANVKITDIGTGSGCIAVVLSKNIEGSEVEALDISISALELAKKNAELNKAKVNFFEFDILKGYMFNIKNKYDIIVSNPPYVRESEKQFMKDNVLKYEPGQALFVSEEDPLVYYKKIAEYGKEWLKKEGNLYFEINEEMGNGMVQMMKNSGYKNIVLKKDIAQKDRMLKAQII